MNINGWKFVKKKSELFKNTNEKEKEKKKWSWKKNGEKKKKKISISAIWALLCKVSGIDDIWKVKLCSNSL